MWTDPTVGALIGGDAPHVLEWVHRMLWPRAEGPFEAWPTLAPTLMPILTTQGGRKFMPWTLANEKALAEGNEEFSLTLGDDVWTQKPQKYHARSLGMLRDTLMLPTRPRSTRFSMPQVALPDCAPRYRLPSIRGPRSWNYRNTRMP
jgi:hypothetical protein